MSKVDVIMPQMGESIAEGTLTRWLKQIGETVERDEDLFEISTDKVDADIPSPVAGTLVEILVEEGATVEVNTSQPLLSATDPDAEVMSTTRTMAMNADKLGPGEHCASTSNRNFEGRQGFGGRTHLVSPAMAAAAAVAGHFVDVRELQEG